MPRPTEVGPQQIQIESQPFWAKARSISVQCFNPLSTHGTFKIYQIVFTSLI